MKYCYYIPFEEGSILFVKFQSLKTQLWLLKHSKLKKTCSVARKLFED